MRRRRLIMRSTVLVLALVGVVALTFSSAGSSFGRGVLAVLLGIVAVVEAVRIVAVLRDRTPDQPPPGAWWWCELPIDHRYVRLATDDPTWRCRRCGDLRHTPPPRATIDVALDGEAGSAGGPTPG